MVARRPLVMGADGLPQVIQPDDTLVTGLRIQAFTGTVAGGAGVASVAFGPAFKAPPLAFVQESWINGQMVCGMVTATTATGCTVQGMVSRATVLLNGSPFTTAPDGTAVVVIVIGV